MRQQALSNRGKTTKAAPTSPSGGVPLQRDDIGSLTAGFKVETHTRDDTNGTLEGEHEQLQDTDGKPGMRSHEPWLMGITNSISPDMDHGMMDATQDLTKMHEQMFGVSVERHVHNPPSNDQHDQEELLVTTSTTGTTQDEHEDRLLYKSQTAYK